EPSRRGEGRETRGNEQEERYLEIPFDRSFNIAARLSRIYDGSSHADILIRVSGAGGHLPTSDVSVWNRQSLSLCHPQPASDLGCYIGRVGHRSHAKHSRQPRQVRKEATVTGSCLCSGVAGVRLFLSLPSSAPIPKSLSLSCLRAIVHPSGGHPVRTFLTLSLIVLGLVSGAAAQTPSVNADDTLSPAKATLPQAPLVEK